MMNAERNMTPRLLAIADCVSSGAKIADVGTDHAYIPIFLVQKGRIDSALAMDINIGPLERAAKNIAKFGMENHIQTRLSDGLKEFRKGEATEIVIAGMGGTLICEILDARKDLWTKDLRFILQPMTASEVLRKYLHENGFYIETEHLAKEENKIYQILTVVRGAMKIEKEAYYYISPYLLANRTHDVKDLLDLRIAEFEKMLYGLQASRREEMHEKEQYVRHLLKQLYDMKEECNQW